MVNELQTQNSKLKTLNFKLKTLNPSLHTDDARFLELLERWLTGEFNRSDEGELYALTAADPFRREAWEGFTSLPEHQHELYLERLRRRLRAPQGKRIPLGIWMSAAAVFLLLIAAFYFIPDWQPKQDLQPMAKAQEVIADTSTEIAATEQQPMARKSVPPGSAFLKNKSTGTAAATQDDALFSEQKEEADMAFQEAEMAEEDAKRSKTATAERQEKESQRNADVLKDAPAKPSAGNANLGKALPGAPVVATAPSPSSKADTFIRKPADVSEAVSRAKKQAPATETATAQPRGGWDDFHRFLNQNARLPLAARNNNISGKVRLQFTVGPDGKPANVQILQALGYGCEEEAMRLIRLFDWAPPGLTPVVVEVPFVR